MAAVNLWGMTAHPLPPDDLTPDEEQELANHEAVIERGLKTYVDVGEALLAIRDRRLYRKAFETFDDYLVERCDMSHAQGYRLIDAYETVERLREMSPNGDVAIPPRESQARELKRAHPAVVLGRCQERIRAGGGYGKHTAAEIRRIVQTELDRYAEEQRRVHSTWGWERMQVLLRDFDDGKWDLDEVPLGDSGRAALRLIDLVLIRLAALRNYVATGVEEPPPTPSQTRDYSHVRA